jgi:hypothetical protein
MIECHRLGRHSTTCWCRRGSRTVAPCRSRSPGAALPRRPSALKWWAIKASLRWMAARREAFRQAACACRSTASFSTWMKVRLDRCRTAQPMSLVYMQPFATSLIRAPRRRPISIMRCACRDLSTTSCRHHGWELDGRRQTGLRNNR